MIDRVIQKLVMRLSRQHDRGGRVIDRAAILAPGAEPMAILSRSLPRVGSPRS
jgi:hypothetical protein